MREHAEILRRLDVSVTEVKSLHQFREIDGLVIPGGESTTISKLLRIFGLFDPLLDLIRQGLPVFGTCAGLIILAQRLTDGIEGQETLGVLDVTVRRNAFGHQTASFETSLEVQGMDRPVAAAFIRAPIITEVGSQASTLSTLDDGSVVAVRQERLLGISFHPEICNETALHDYFVREVV